MKTKNQQHKLPCFREDSWGPLIYSSAEQTEQRCSSFDSSPKQLCQRPESAFLTSFILREKQFLQRVKAWLHPNFLRGSGLDSKQKQACVGFLTPEQSFQRKFPPPPPTLTPLGPQLKGKVEAIVLSLHLSCPVTRIWETLIPPKWSDMRKAPETPSFSGTQKCLVNNWFGFVEGDKENKEFVSTFKNNQLCTKPQSSCICQPALIALITEGTFWMLYEQFYLSRHQRPLGHVLCSSLGRFRTIKKEWNNLTSADKQCEKRRRA